MPAITANMDIDHYGCGRDEQEESLSGSDFGGEFDGEFGGYIHDFTAFEFVPIAIPPYWYDKSAKNAEIVKGVNKAAEEVAVRKMKEMEEREAIWETLPKEPRSVRERKAADAKIVAEYEAANCAASGLGKGSTKFTFGQGSSTHKRKGGGKHRAKTGVQEEVILTDKQLAQKAAEVKLQNEKKEKERKIWEAANAASIAAAVEEKKLEIEAAKAAEEAEKIRISLLPQDELAVEQAEQAEINDVISKVKKIPINRPIFVPKQKVVKQKDDWTKVKGKFASPVSKTEKIQNEIQQAFNEAAGCSVGRARRQRASGEKMLGDKTALAKVLTKTTLCKSVTDKSGKLVPKNKRKKCHHKECRFAHSLAELQVRECIYGDSCRKKDSCCGRHPGETDAQWKSRMTT